MKLLLLFILIFLLCDVYSDWYMQNSGTNVSLNAVYFVNSSTGYAAGNNGTILKTTNKGLNWVSKNTQSSKNLYSVTFTDSIHGYAAGDSIILKTTDGGNSWSSYTIHYPMKSVFFVSSQTGYIAAYYGTVLKTTNGGANWNSQIINDPVANYTCIFFSNINTGYVVGLSGRYSKTYNGGLNWAQKPVFYNKNYYSIQFPSRSTGFLTGGWVTGMILKSVNEGEYFEPLVNEFTGVRLFSSSFIDTLNGIAVGRQGYIIRTTNGGIDWNEENPGTTSILYCVQYIKPDAAYAVGENGTIISTVNVIGINQLSSRIPSDFSLEQNYPNPFNPETRIRFSIKHTEFVTIKIYDILGKEIKSVVSQELTPGTYETNFSAYQITGGTYFYTISAGSFRQTRKMVLIK